MARTPISADALGLELERIGALTAAELRVLWQSQRGAAPPASATARQMRAALAWDLQAAAFGGEPSALRRRWQKIEQARAAGAAPAEAIDGTTSVPPAAVGTRLIKTWHGRTHDVRVTAEGVEWQGKTYRSLSGVARAITGTSRNGPAFFGLRAEGTDR